MLFDKTYPGKACRRCGSTERYKSTGGCAPCTRTDAKERALINPDRTRFRKAEDYRQHKDRHRDYKLQYTYGISLAEYDEMLVRQGGCAICGAQECGSGRNFCVDHCHATGRVRGVLCLNCNRAVGNMRDDPGLLRKAAEYLEASLED